MSKTLHTPKAGWKTVSDLPGNCVPTAFKLVSGESDERVFNAAFKCGFESTGGMYQYNWIKMFDLLGLSHEKCDLNTIKTTSRDRWGYESFNHGTLAAFCREFKDGVYLVSVARHLLVVQDGAVVDPNMGSRIGGRRRVHQAWKIHQSPLKAVSVADKPKGKKLTKSMTFEVIRGFTTYRYGSKHRLGYESLQRLPHVGIQKGSRFTLADLALCDYTRAQLNYDIKRGNVRIVD